MKQLTYSQQFYEYWKFIVSPTLSSPLSWRRCGVACVRWLRNTNTGSRYDILAALVRVHRRCSALHCHCFLLCAPHFTLNANIVQWIFLHPFVSHVLFSLPHLFIFLGNAGMSANVFAERARWSSVPSCVWVCIAFLAFSEQMHKQLRRRKVGFLHDSQNWRALDVIAGGIECY